MRDSLAHESLMLDLNTATASLNGERVELKESIVHPNSIFFSNKAGASFFPGSNGSAPSSRASSKPSISTSLVGTIFAWLVPLLASLVLIVTLSRSSALSSAQSLVAPLLIALSGATTAMKAHKSKDPEFKLKSCLRSDRQGRKAGLKPGRQGLASKMPWSKQDAPTGDTKALSGALAKNPTWSEQLEHSLECERNLECDFEHDLFGFQLDGTDDESESESEGEDFEEVIEQDLAWEQTQFDWEAEPRSAPPPGEPMKGQFVGQYPTPKLRLPRARGKPAMFIVGPGRHFTTTRVASFRKIV